MEVFTPTTVHSADQVDFLTDQKRQGWQILGSETVSDQNLNGDPALRKPTILVIGSEGEGMENDLKTICDDFVHIKPGRNLEPEVDSLNVSVATALLIQSLKTSIK